MEQNNQQNQQVDAIQSGLTLLSSAAATAQQLFPEMQTSSQRACLALSKVQVIEDDVTDAQAEKLLVAVRTTFEGIQNKRMQFTRPMNDFIALAMVPEKSISTAPEATGSEYNRVKGLRNKFANAKQARIEAEQQAIKADKARADEVVRLNIAWDKSCFEGNLAALASLDQRLAGAFNMVTLETYDNDLARFSAAPAPLPVATWKSWFGVPFSTIVDMETYNRLLNENMKKFNYEQCNGEYIPKAFAKIKYWFDKLLAKKQELIEIANLAAQNQQAAQQAEEQRLQREKQEQDTRQQQQAAEANNLSQAKEFELTIAEEDAKQTNSFNQQIATQQVDNLEGVKKLNIATITAEDENLVVTISDLFYNVFINPKYKGIIKRNADGSPKVDTDGRPMYEDWLEKLLQFYADNCEHKVEGITISHKVATSQRKRS